MPLVRLRDEIEEAVVAALECVSPPDEIVSYDISIERMEVGSEEEMGDFGQFETVVMLYLALDCPEINGRSYTHVRVPIGHFSDPDYVLHMIQSLWDRLVINRMEARIS